MLAGVGFTVSLLIGELAFGTGSAADDHVKVGVLVGSLLAALLAAVVLRSPQPGLPADLASSRSVTHDADGVPDVYQHDDETRLRVL